MSKNRPHRSEAPRLDGTANGPATIEIDIESRWDAVALMKRLGPYHPYLIQLAPQRWLVHAKCPGCHDEPLPRALAAIQESLTARHVERAEVRVDGRPCRPAIGARRSP